MSVLQKLTEGVQSRNLQAEGAALLNKWEATGLLEGLNDGQHKQGMAVLLENQAKELLREASAMAAGDVEGFAAVAFPIVRRVFGGLIANDLVSVQPMSLPSGLIFFLDFVKSPDARGDGSSLYGGNVIGSQVTGGVDLSGARVAGGNGLDAGGFYDFNTGFSHATSSQAAGTDLEQADALVLLAGTTDVDDFNAASDNGETLRKLVKYDADLLSAAGATTVMIVDVDVPGDLNRTALSAVDCGSGTGIVTRDASANANAGGADTLAATARQVKRLTQIVDTAAGEKLRLVFIDESGAPIVQAAGGQLAQGDGIAFTYPKHDELGNVGPAVPGGVVVPADAAGESGSGASAMPLERASDMAEIDIKVDSIAVTAQTKKLKAKWSPELGQDLNAYHNLDAEVELTGILSEQIALEIDRELLGDLVQGATAGTRYWSRAPGLFVDSDGREIGARSAAPDFTGTVSEWYETLIETINDVSAQIHRKTLRGGANFVVCSPEVANILEFTSGFRASVTADQDRGTIGAVKAGSLSKKFDVYVDPYFLRNVILVGRKGSSFLESGFVYAPYVPLQVTPTIFGTEDFVPRKGVMTRYAKKMVRPDMYGLVVVRGLLGEAGR